MPSMCRRCHSPIPSKSPFESQSICRACMARLPRKNKATKFSYKASDHHKIRAMQAKQRLHRQNTVFDRRMEPARPQMTRASTMFEGKQEQQPPDILQLQCIVLFVPFDAGKSIYKKSAKNGTFTADFIPSGNNILKPFGSPDQSYALPKLNNKEYPGQKVFEAKGKDAWMEPEEIADSYDAIVWKHIQSCVDVRELELLPHNAVERALRLMQIAPEIVFLSEEVPGAPFPSQLAPHPALVYRQIASIKGTLGPSVDCKNEIAAYVLYDQSCSVPILYDARVLERQGCVHKEKWLSVSKILPEFNVWIEVAGVHLDAGYTRTLSQDDKADALTEVGQFALDKGVDALLGDLNMDSFELNGGFFPNKRGFETTHDDKVVSIWTLSHSNSNAKNNFMGGMIVNSDQVETVPMNLTGQDTMSLSRTLDGQFYSDHPAIVVNYVKSF